VAIQIKLLKKNVAILTFFVPKVGDEKEVAKLGMEDSPVLGRQLVCILNVNKYCINSFTNSCVNFETKCNVFGISSIL
jgi:hypothetical protein